MRQFLNDRAGLPLVLALVWLPLGCAPKPKPQPVIPPPPPGDLLHYSGKVNEKAAGKVEAMEDGHETMGFKGLRIGGVIDPTFVYTQRQNNAGFVFLNNFDGRSPGESYAFDNSYFGMAMLDVQKVTDTDQRWRLTLAPHKSASSGTNLGSIVHEASVALPLDGPNLRLLAGQFPDWSGYEYYFANQQPLISHNLLFDFTVPSFYSGVGMEFVNGKWATKVLLGNINQVRVPDGQKSPGLSFRVDYAKGEFSGFGFAGSHTTTKGAQVTQGEVDGYFIRGDWTLQGQLGLGSARGGDGTGQSKTIGTLVASGPTEGIGTGEKTEKKVRAIVQESAPQDLDPVDLDPAAVAAKIRQYRGALVACYEAALKRNAGLAGKITLRFSISKLGKVSNVEIEVDTMHDDDFSKCIVERASSWRFPPPQSGNNEVQFAYPFIFQSSK